MTVEATIKATYHLIMSSGWILLSSNIEDYSYQAKHGPTVALIEETTCDWNGEYEWVSEYLSYPDNEFIVEYREHDESGFKGCVVDWKKTLFYRFNLSKGGWYITDVQYEITDVVLDVVGLWTWEDGDEFLKLDVLSATDSEIQYNIDIALRDPLLGGFVGEPIMGGFEDQTKSWEYEYLDNCLTFDAGQIFKINLGFYLYYKTYLVELDGTSGFYVDGMLLSLSDE